MGIATVTALFGLLFLLQLMPGLHNVPRWPGIDRLIGRGCYRTYGSAQARETVAAGKRK